MAHISIRPQRGWFGGALGCVAGLEVLRTIADHDLKTRAGIELAVFSNEEGARFQPAMLGSGVVGRFSAASAHSRGDSAGCQFREELKRRGLQTTASW